MRRAQPGVGTAGAATTIAFAAALAHVLIDYHLGLYGAHSTAMAPLQAAAVAANAAIFGWWWAASMAAVRGDGSAHAAVLLFAIVEAALLNGAVAIVAAPPPSHAFPYQDLVHLLALGAGTTAAVLLRRARPHQRDGWAGWLPGGVVVLIVGHTVLAVLQIRYS